VDGTPFEHPPERRSNRKVLLGAAAIVVVAVIVGAGVVLTRHDGARSHGGAAAAPAVSLKLVADAAPESGWREIIPAFANTPAGKGVTVATSYGASGDQSRKVVDTKLADIVNFTVEPDVTRLIEANLVAKDWNADVTRGIPFGSVVTLVVRSGNPKGIRDWDDLLKPGVEVVTASPLSSGSAKWNLLAPYADKSNGGKNPQAGLDYITQLVTEHVRLRPDSGSAATDTFLRGTGDVLISPENEALHAERQGKPVEHVIPPQTIRIENPVAVVTATTHLEQATALKNFLYTPQGQKLWAAAGFRPVDPAVAADFAAAFPSPSAKLWTIDDLGGWTIVDPALFDRDNGSISAIFKTAGG
jgi:sulfate/thiosulfate transport system substrate-binding protein